MKTPAANRNAGSKIDVGFDGLRDEIKKRARWNTAFAFRVIKKWHEAEAAGMTYADFNKRLNLDPQRVRAWEKRLTEKKPRPRAVQSPPRPTVPRVTEEQRDSLASVRQRLEGMVRDLRHLASEAPSIASHVNSAVKNIVDGIKSTLDAEFATTILTLDLTDEQPKSQSRSKTG